LATVARVMQISRQALYRTPTPRAAPQRRPIGDPVEAAIVAEAVANQTDGYRMVCGAKGRKHGRKRGNALERAHDRHLRQDSGVPVRCASEAGFRQWAS
jgi:hypothetical protein